MFLLIGFLCLINVTAQKKVLVDVPMKFRGPTPAVEVMVNGKGPFLFAIDTGAQGGARIDSSLVAQLGLKTSGQAQASDGSGRNVQTLETVEVDSIALGDIKLDKVTAITRNYNTSPNLPKIDGILGYGLFADYLLTLDFPAKRVRVETGELPKTNAANVLNLDSSRGIAIVEIEVGNQKVKAHLDSGNTVGGFILATAVVEKAALASEPIVVGRARTVSNDVEIKQVRLKDTIRLGGFEFSEPTVTFPALSDANVGSKILGEFAATFDQKNNRLKLERAKAAQETKAETKQIAKTEPSNATDYVGSYGDRTVTESGGMLFIQRPQGMKLKLAAVSKDEFTLEQVPAARIKFARDENGKITEIQVLNSAGVWEKAKKEKP